MKTSTLAIFSICLLITQLAQAQFVDLSVSKMVNKSIVFPGEQMTYTITVSNLGPDDASNVFFNDNLPINAFDVSYQGCTAQGGAICPFTMNLNISDTNFSGTIPFIPVNGQVMLMLQIRAPAPPINPGSFSNTVTVQAEAGTVDVNPLSNISTINTSMDNSGDIAVYTDISPSDTMDCALLPMSYDIQVQWVNQGMSYVNQSQLLSSLSITDQFYDNSGNSEFIFAYSISDTLWQASSSSSLPMGTFSTAADTFTSFSGSVLTFIESATADLWAPGDTISLKFTLTLQAPEAIGCGRGYSFAIQNTASVNLANTNTNDINTSNNTAVDKAAIANCDPPECKDIDISVTVTDSMRIFTDCDSLPDTYSYTIEWVNNGIDSANGAKLVSSLFIGMPAYDGLGTATFAFPYAIKNQLWEVSSSGTSIPTAMMTPDTGVMFNVFVPLAGVATLGNEPYIVEKWAPGDTIRFAFEIRVYPPTITGCGRSYSFDLQSSATFSLIELPLTDTITDNNFSLFSHRILQCEAEPCPLIDIETVSSIESEVFDGCNDFPVVTKYEHKWINKGPDSANNIAILSSLSVFGNQYSGPGNAVYGFPFEVSNVLWKASGAGATVPALPYTPMLGTLSSNLPAFTNFSSVIAPIEKWPAGDTITLTYTLSLKDPTVVGCGRSFDFGVRATTSFSYNATDLIDTVSDNNTSIVSFDGISVSAVDLVIAKSISPQLLAFGDTLRMQINFQNATGSGIEQEAVWTDTLPAEFDLILESIACEQIMGAADCAAITYDSTSHVLSQRLQNMPPGSELQVTFSGIVRSPDDASVSTSAQAMPSCRDCFEATNRSQVNFQIDNSAVYFDWGDAPDTYETTMAEDGAVHRIVDYDSLTQTAPLMIGTRIAAEDDGQPSIFADSEADDDGISVTYDGTTITVVASVLNMASEQAQLFGWFDSNKSGTFSDDLPIIYDSIPVSSTATERTYFRDYFPFNDIDTVYFRFRLSTDPLMDAPTGTAIDGEVHDFAFVIVNCSLVPLVSGSYPNCLPEEGGIEVILLDANVPQVSLDSINWLNGDTVIFDKLAAGDYTVYVRDSLLPDCDTSILITLIPPDADTLAGVNACLCFGIQPQDVDAGTLSSGIVDACLEDGNATINAILNNDAGLPPSYEIHYLLVRDSVVLQLNTSPEFTVTDTGEYTIHSFVFNPDFFDAQVLIGSKVSTIHTLLVPQGDVCADLDIEGVKIKVEDCRPCINIGDYVWFDNNKNGIQDNEENGVRNFEAWLMKAGTDGVFGTSDDAIEDIEMTRLNGRYLFECVPPGVYRIWFPDYQLEVDEDFTLVNVGNDDALDSDVNPATAATAPFAITEDQEDSDLSFDAGIIKNCTDVIYGGEICCNQTICEGEAPARIQEVVPAFGQLPGVQYVWMYTTNPSSSSVINWIAIPGSNSRDYQPPALFETTSFVRCVRNINCSVFIKESNIVTIEVEELGGQDCPEPIMDIDLDIVSERAIAVNWQCNNETAEMSYTVEHSTDDLVFSEIGHIECKNNQQPLNTYRFQHTQAKRGINYYRVRVEKAGRFIFYSRTHQAKLHSPHLSAVIASPSPFGSSLVIESVGKQLYNGKISLYNVAGQLKRENTFSADAKLYQEWDTIDLPSGVYILRISHESPAKDVKIIRVVKNN